MRRRIVLTICARKRDIKMGALYDLYFYCKAVKEKGKRVISVDYVVDALQRHVGESLPPSSDSSKQEVEIDDGQARLVIEDYSLIVAEEENNGVIPKKVKHNLSKYDKIDS